METQIRTDIPQAEVWENVKEMLGEGFQVFSFEMVADGSITIRAVSGLVETPR